MSIEYVFLFCCIGLLVLVTLALTFNTLIMGKSCFKTFQFIMSSMPFSKEADDIINQLFAKVEAGLLTANISSSGSTIQFFENEPEAQTEVVTTRVVDELSGTYFKAQIQRTMKAEAEIWIDTKYYGYGYIHRYYGEQKSELYKKRPSVSTFKRIVKFENQLRGAPTVNDAPPSSTERKEKNVVELS